METVYYLGASTPKGFYSHFESLFDEVQQVNIIKGGSGCGKSTFMRSLGKAAAARGLEVTYILCSSDPDSLDGVVFPQLSLAYLDGTAPHVVEPKLCGGSMNYLNFGEFYHREAMRPNEDRIRAAQKENAGQYPHVTACLASADRLLDSVRFATAGEAYEEELSAIAVCFGLSTLEPLEGAPKLSKRFLSAVTPKGLQFCDRTPAALCKRVYVLRDNYLLAPRVLGELMEKALSLGHHCVACYSPLLPDDQPTHLLIPTANVAFVSESRDFPYTGECFCRMDLDSTLPDKTRQSLSFCNKTVSALLYQAVSHMREAKRWHDQIEQLCKPFVDFGQVDVLTRKTIREIFGEK